MKKTIVSLIITQLAVFPSVAFATCTHAVGDVVKILPPATVAEQMSSYAVVKDEFESTEEFNARKKTALENISNGTMLVEATYDPKKAHYDADTERFLIEKWAWGGVGGWFHASVPSVDIIDSLEAHAVGLQIEESVIGTYPASNSFGKEVEVIKVLQTVYGVFDRKSKSSEKTWAFNFKKSGSYSDGNHRAEGIFLPVPRTQAKTLKSGMRFGIEFTPKEPFLFQGDEDSKPTIKSPIETVTKISTITGELECLVITDAKGTVLKVVEAGY